MALTPRLPEHQPGSVGVGGHQVHPGQLLAMDPAHALAVDRDRRPTAGQVPFRPAPQGLLEGGHVELDEDPVEGGDAGRPRAGEAQRPE
jgi:hypothetical protein